MAASYKHILLISLATLRPLNSMAQIACQDVFAPETTYHNEAVERAILKKALENGTRKLSPNDLTKLIHKMFDKYEGKEYEVSHYLRMTAAERTKAMFFRQASETITHQGLKAYFREKGLLVDSSTLTTKLWVINRSKSFNLFSAIGAAMGLVNRYYTRVAVAVAFILMHDKLEDFLSQDHDSIPADVWTLFLSELQKYEEKIP